MRLTVCDRCRAVIEEDSDFSIFEIADPGKYEPFSKHRSLLHLCRRCRAVFDLFLKAGKS